MAQLMLEILEGLEASARDPFRLDGDGEKCVETIKEKLIKSIDEDF